MSRAEDTEITFPPAVLAEHPELEGVSITVPADSLFADDGTRGGMVGIAAVPPDRLPGELPPGLEFPIVITVQTDGATNFDVPVPACFPNLPDPETGEPLPANSKSALFSFNHDTGRFELAGPMTVSADGQLVCTDPGVGIPAPGWHGTQPGASGTGRGGGQCGSGSAVGIASRGVSVGCVFAGAGCAATLLGAGLAGFATFATLGLAAVAGVAAGLAVVAACGGAACVCGALPCGDPPPDPSCPPAAAVSFVTPAVSGPIDELLSLYEDALPIIQQITDIYLAAQFKGELTEEQEAELDTLRAQLDALAGGDFLSTVRALRAELFSQVIPISADFPPQGPVHYSVQTERGVIIRGRTSSDGGYQVVLGPSQDGALLTFFDPGSWTVGFTQMPEIVPGARVTLHDYLLTIDITNADDTDGDGLPDIGEVVLGTELLNPDTDGDGILDGPEVRQGTDPLGGLVAQTGIIATADTPGTALDVCAVNDIAIVADSDQGISVFSVFNGMNPTVIARVNTPGTALAVACSGDLVAVADGVAGLAVIDVTDPPAAHILHQVDLGSTSRSVLTAANIAFVGLASGQVVSVDMISGALLDQVSVANAAIQDLAIGGETL